MKTNSKMAFPGKMPGKMLVQILIQLIIAILPVAALAVDTNSPSFLVRFDSTQTQLSDGANTVSSRVLANFLVGPVEGETGRYRGQGRLRYVELDGLPDKPSDGVLTITDLFVSEQDGTVMLDLFPGDPKPIEWLVLAPGVAIKQFQWFSNFGLFHDNELGPGGFTIENWDYSAEEIYSSKTYNRNMTVETADLTESTRIELTLIPDPPRIDVINIVSMGASADDPETGEVVELSADLFVPIFFEIERCTWTGNNISGAGVGDKDDNCRWTYKPKEGKGPKRDTYGQKNLTLTVTYRYLIRKSVVSLSKSKAYKVFFSKLGDDDSNAAPNWFDYWGDDGAVPGLDDSNVKYKASLDATTIAEADGTNVTFGPNGAGVDGLIAIPKNDICVGGTFPGAEGIDLTAISLSHERKHNQLDALTGTDTDGDGVIDTAESGTSITNRDSCDLAGQIHSVYATYGDHEFIARQAELGVEGVAGKDWALPGRQASMTSAAVSSLTVERNGMLSGSRAQVSGLAFQSGLQAVSVAANGMLSGTYNAVGLNPGGDGLFTSMRLDVGLNIVDAEHYSLIAWLADDQGTEFAWARTAADLGVGTTTLQLVFDGAGLNRAGIAQPFVVSRVELEYQVGKHSVLGDSATNVLVTAYDSSDFAPPAAILAGVDPEMPVDFEPDGFINQLDFTVNLDTYGAGEYEISAQLQGNNLRLFAAQTIVVPDNTDSAQVTLSFAGQSIFFSREDGPFSLTNLQVKEVAGGARLDFQSQALTTAAYPFVAFQNSGVVIDETSYADMGGELDSNGKYMTLDIQLSIGSMVPGLYSVSASLEGSEGRTIAMATTSIGLGGVESYSEVTAVTLSFLAADIFASGMDGPYQLAGVSVVSDAGVLMDQNPTPWMTSAYSVNDFGVVILSEDIFVDGFE